MSDREHPSGRTRNRAFLPALAGYLAGLATAGVIAVLWPAPDAGSGPGPAPAGSRAVAAPPATPAAPSSTAGAPQAAAGQDVPQHSAAPLSAEARARIAQLEARLAAAPDDLLARKQLAVVLLQNQQLMLAYEHASAILAADPVDPDGLYVHSVVRLAMGHAALAIELLDRVLARYPDHALALEARARAQRKIGDQGGAELTEAMARQATSKGDTEVEKLLAAASDGTLIEMIRSGSPAAGEGANGG